MNLRVRRIREVVCGSAVALALCAVPAFAQQQQPAPPPPPAQQPTFTQLPPEPEGFTLTPFIGAGFSGDMQSAPAAFGLGLGYGWSPRVSLEAELGITPNGSIGIPTLEFDTSVWTLSGNVLYHFITQDNFTPYVTGGIGVLGSSPDLPSADLFPELHEERTNSFAWNVGAGIKSALTERFGVRADLRHFNGSGLAPDHWRLYGGVVVRRIGQW